MRSGNKNLNQIIWLSLSQTIPGFNDLDKPPFENIVEKGENAGNKHFLLSPQRFILSSQISPF